MAPKNWEPGSSELKGGGWCCRRVGCAQGLSRARGFALLAMGAEKLQQGAS